MLIMKKTQKFGASPCIVLDMMSECLRYLIELIAWGNWIIRCVLTEFGQIQMHVGGDTVMNLDVLRHA